MSDLAPSAHPSVDKLRTFGLGQLDPGEASRVEEHVSHCEACCRTLSEVGPDTLVSLLRHARKLPEELHESGTVALTQASVEAVLERPSVRENPTLPGLPPELANHPRYRVLALLGAGGMGSVYKAEHRLMERPVALKVMAASLVGSPEMIERFRREVKAAARLSHANIVTAHDAEQAGDLHLLIMEYVEGTDLAHVVAERGPLPVAQACEYVRQAAAGLQHAHEHGMIHRDIKPHNLMLTPHDAVKILDFGLARLAGDAGSQPGTGTAQGTVLGTVDYMAPEQADDAHQADIRSDIYSLGCTLYQLLSGRPPFPKGTLVQKIMAHTERLATPLRELRPDVPPGLARIVERMMAKPPSQRYQTPAEVRVALEPFAEAAVALAEPTPRRSPTLPHRKAGNGSTEAVPLRKRRPLRDEPVLEALPVPDRPRRRRAILLAVFLPMLLGGLLAGAVAVYRIKTDNGELIIKTDNPDVEVVIKQNGKIVRIIDTKTNKEVKLDSGRYELELGHQAEGPEGLQLSMDRVTIRRGGTVVATITRRTKAMAQEKVGEVRRFEGHDAQVVAVDFSPNGLLALSSTGDWAGGTEFVIRIWDLATGKELRRLEGHRGIIYGAVFSRDGKRILSCGDDQTMRLWDVESGKELKRLEAHTGKGVLAVALSPDGKRALSCGWDKTVRLWDLEKGKELKILEGHTEPVRRVAFSPDGRLALSSSFDTTIRLWDLEKGELLKTLEGHTEKVHGVAFLPNGKQAVSCAFDGTIRLWDLESGKQLKEIRGPNRMHALALSTDGRRLLTAAWDQTVRLWDLETGQQLHCFFGHTDKVNGAALSLDGRWALSGGWDRTMRLWRLPAPPPEKVGEIRRFVGHEQGMIQVAVSRDGRLAISGSADHTARLWDVATGKELHKLDGHTNQVYAVAFSPNCRLALTGSEDHLMKLWDVESGKEVRTFEGHTGIVTGVAFSPDGKQALSSSSDGTLRLWEVETGKEVRKFEGHTSGVQSVAFSPDGLRAASCGFDRTVRLWDVTMGVELRKFEGHTDMVRVVAYSADGRRLLSGGHTRDDTVRLWDIETGRELRRMPARVGGVHGVSFSPDGRRALACGNGSDVVQLWDLERGWLVCLLKGHTIPEGRGVGSVGSAVFLSDGRHALSGSADKTLRLWRLPDPAAK